MRHGVFGGTFNPIHHGHLRLVEEAILAYSLDAVHMVLSSSPPHKGQEEIAPTEQRWSLLRLACEGNPKLIPCPVEMQRHGPSFTIETLHEIRRTVSAEDEIYLLMGIDSAAEMHTWKDYRNILSLVKIIAAPRGNTHPSSLNAEVSEQVMLMEAPMLDISSTRIRDLIRQGASTRYLMPERVEAEIKASGMYQACGGTQRNCPEPRFHEALT